VRSFADGAGRRWSVSVGRESWGTQLLLFSPEDGAEPVRKAPLHAESPLEAARELDGLSEAALRSLLTGSEPWG
jgi:hypothetical protein